MLLSGQMPREFQVSQQTNCNRDPRPGDPGEVDSVVQSCTEEQMSATRSGVLPGCGAKGVWRYMRGEWAG